MWYSSWQIEMTETELFESNEVKERMKLAEYPDYRERISRFQKTGYDHTGCARDSTYGKTPDSLIDFTPETVLNASRNSHQGQKLTEPMIAQTR